MKRNLSMILARAENGALGLDGKLPWSHPEDRAFFERTTRGHVVIMGRRTWEEEGRPLPDRLNIVVSRTFTAPAVEGVVVARSLDDALAHAWSVDAEPFVIGGAALFTEVLPRVTRIYLTEIPGSPDADVFFELDRTGFHVTHERTGEAGARFLVLDRDA
jgi:dihydrofolate reductase